jgi:hypothetical protein
MEAMPFLPALPHSTLTSEGVRARLETLARKNDVVALSTRRPEAPGTTPFQAEAIFAAFQDRSKLLRGLMMLGPIDPSPVRMVRVATPSNLAQVAEVMHGLGHPKGLRAIVHDEYGVFTYANPAGELRTYVARGDNFSVNPPQALEVDGQKWMLAGILAHLHPNHDPHPSSADQGTVGSRAAVDGQRRSLVVDRLGQVTIFDGAQCAPAQNLAGQSLDDLFVP